MAENIVGKTLVHTNRVFLRDRGCWNCVAGDALVLTRGVALPIERASKATAVYSRNGWRETNAWRSVGVRDVVEIQSSHGLRVKVTPDHLIATDRGWIPAGELRLGRRGSGDGNRGDVLVGIPEVALSHADVIDRREAFFLGAVTGDGWLNADKGIGFCCDGLMRHAFEKDMLAFAADRLRSREQFHLNRGKGSNGTFHTIEWRTQAARAYSIKFDKFHVPDPIWKSTPDCIGAYLRGLFTTDGTMSAGPPSWAAFFQTTKTLVDEVRMLLRLVGIESQLHVAHRLAPHHDLFSVQISRRRSLRRFAEIAGFADERRQRMLEASLARPMLHDRSCEPERVRNVVNAGSAPVFDISVPGEECFFANGLLVHNCVHWDNGEAAKRRYDQMITNGEKVAMRDAQAALLGAASESDLRNLGMSGPQAKLAAMSVDQRYAVWDKINANGRLGVCTIGQNWSTIRKPGPPKLVCRGTVLRVDGNVVESTLGRKFTVDALPLPLPAKGDLFVVQKSGPMETVVSPPAHFVHPEFLCEKDGRCWWSGRPGHSLARQGKALDKPLGELWEEAESREKTLGPDVRMVFLAGPAAGLHCGVTDGVGQDEEMTTEATP